MPPYYGFFVFFLPFFFYFSFSLLSDIFPFGLLSKVIFSLLCAPLPTFSSCLQKSPTGLSGLCTRQERLRKEFSAMKSSWSPGISVNDSREGERMEDGKEFGREYRR